MTNNPQEPTTDHIVNVLFGAIEKGDSKLERQCFAQLLATNAARQERILFLLETAHIRDTAGALKRTGRKLIGMKDN